MTPAPGTRSEGLLRGPEPSNRRSSALSGSGLRLFLARHGVTEENLRGEVQGHRPGTLTEQGRRWAEETGRRLRGEGIERIYASDLARALETANLMALGLGGIAPNSRVLAGEMGSSSGRLVEVVPEPLLRERAYGDLEGRTKAQLRLDYPDFYSVDMPERGVEPLASVFNRLEQFLVLLFRDMGANSAPGGGGRSPSHPLPATMVVAHGGTNSYLTNLLLGEGRVMHPAHNEVACFQLDGEGRVVEYTPAWNGHP